jgi:hypothetical protein
MPAFGAYIYRRTDTEGQFEPIIPRIADGLRSHRVAGFCKQKTAYRDVIKKSTARSIAPLDKARFACRS